MTLSARLALLTKERAREEQEIAALTGRLEQHASKLTHFSAELSDLNRRAGGIRDSRGGIEVQRAEAQARLTFVRENCAAELNQSLEELAQAVAFGRRIRS